MGSSLELARSAQVCESVFCDFSLKLKNLNTLGKFALGHAPTANHVPLSAFVDEFCVFNTSLTSDYTALQTIYTRGCGQGALAAYPKLKESLTYHLSFDEDRVSIPEFKDSVRGEYDATGNLDGTNFWDNFDHISPVHVPSSAPFVGDGNHVSFLFDS